MLKKSIINMSKLTTYFLNVSPYIIRKNSHILMPSKYVLNYLKYKKHILCKHENCTNTAIYGIHNTHGDACEIHAMEYEINLLRFNICIKCNTRIAVSCNNSIIPLLCNKCAHKKQIVNEHTPRCYICGNIAIFSFINSDRPILCYKHAIKSNNILQLHKLNNKNNICLYENCNNKAVYSYGRLNINIACKKHATLFMLKRNNQLIKNTNNKCKYCSIYYASNHICDTCKMRISSRIEGLVLEYMFFYYNYIYKCIKHIVHDRQLHTTIKLRPDFILKLNKNYDIIIEVDEIQHRYRKNEISRMHNIIKYYNDVCKKYIIIIRFNPHISYSTKYIDVHTRIRILLKYISVYLFYSSINHNKIIYLFYDKIANIYTI